MSDQNSSCTLRLIGTIEKLKLAALAAKLDFEFEDLEDGIVFTENADGGEMPNDWAKAVIDAGLSYCWTCDYRMNGQPSVELYNADIGEVFTSIWNEQQICITAADLRRWKRVDRVLLWDKWLRLATFTVTEGAVKVPEKMVKLTVIVQEVSTPFPPAHPDPLIYTVDVAEAMIEGLTVHSFNEVLEAEIVRQVVQERYEELDGDGGHGVLAEIRDGLRVLFVFKGDIPPAFDFRK